MKDLKEKQIIKKQKKFNEPGFTEEELKEYQEKKFQELRDV